MTYYNCHARETKLGLTQARVTLVSPKASQICQTALWYWRLICTQHRKYNTQGGGYNLGKQAAGTPPSVTYHFSHLGTFGSAYSPITSPTMMKWAHPLLRFSRTHYPRSLMYLLSYKGPLIPALFPIHMVGGGSRHMSAWCLHMAHMQLQRQWHPCYSKVLLPNYQYIPPSP